MVRVMNWITGVHLYELMPNYKVRSVRLMLISTWLLLLLSMPFPFLFEQINLEGWKLKKALTRPLASTCQPDPYRAKIPSGKTSYVSNGLMQLAAISLLWVNKVVSTILHPVDGFSIFIFDRDERGWLKISLSFFSREIFLVQILMDNYQPVVELEPEVVDLIRTQSSYSRYWSSCCQVTTFTALPVKAKNKLKKKSKHLINYYEIHYQQGLPMSLLPMALLKQDCIVHDSPLYGFCKLLVGCRSDESTRTY